MKVLHVVASDGRAGAARGAYGLHRSLRAAGVDSQMLVQQRHSADPTVHGPQRGMEHVAAEFRRQLDTKLTTVLSGPPRAAFSSNLVGSRIGPTLRRLEPDVVHLHYLGRGLLTPEQIAGVRPPVVWTLRGMGPFTGGCELDRGCGRFRAACGCCPLLARSGEWDVSRLTLARKRRAWRSRRFHLAALSSWLAGLARESRLFVGEPVRVIPPGIDVDVFRPVERGVARTALRLPPDGLLVGFSSLVPRGHDPLKGWHLLVAALDVLARRSPALAAELGLVVVGPATDGVELERLPVAAHAVGPLHDDASLALAYAACDVVAMPSLQEAFGKVAAEALACGTPAVAFRDTGTAEIVEDRRSGYLAEHGSTDALAAGLEWALVDGERRASLAADARRRAVTAFAAEREARAYLDLYESILAGTTAAAG